MRCHDVRKAATSVSISALLACLCAGLAGCIQPWHGVFNNNPNIGWGGRAVAVTVDPQDENFVIAASPTGGLFDTALGGSAWGHIEAMPEFGVFDVRFSPEHPAVVVATAIQDTRVVNGGGIWVSTDRGQTWSQPPSAIRYEDVAHTIVEPHSAFGISFVPGTSKVFVGMDDGIAESDDSGATWSFAKTPPNGYGNAMYSVLALASGRVITCGDFGIWISDDGKTNWHHDNEGISCAGKVANSFAVSPLNLNDVFAIDGFTTLYESTDGGLNWTQRDSKTPPTTGRRQATLKIASVDATSFDIYWEINDGPNVKRVKQTASGLDFSAAWKVLNFPNSDPADMAFSRKTGALLYAADDGGIQKTPDGGATWDFATRGSSSNGFDALQVYDVKTVLSTASSAENDVYFGTQDNNLYASRDSGSTWPGLTLPEGGDFQAPVLKGVGNYTQIDLVGQQGMQTSGPAFANPPASYITFPFDMVGTVYFVHDNVFFAFARDTGQGSAIWTTNDGGSTWLPLPGISIKQNIIAYAKLSGSNSNPSIVVPFADVDEIGLLRIDNAFIGLAPKIIVPIPLPPHATPGRYGFQFLKNIASFGVDPKDPDFLILPDIYNNRMYVTSDGGVTWTVRDDLLATITDNGAFKFSTPDTARPNFELSNSQVSSVTFDPLNPNRILIGTAEAGIVYSSDHGMTWDKIKGSERIPNITSFAFLQTQNPEEAYASSWGRGLWTVSLDIENRSHAGAPRPPFGPSPGPAGSPPEPAPGPAGPAAGASLIVRGDLEQARREFFDLPPRLDVHSVGTHLPNGTVAAAQPIEIQGLYWPRMSAGAFIEVGLDGHAPIRVPARVTKAGAFSASLPAMQIAGIHRLDVRQMAGSKQIAHAKLEFTVVVADEGRERERR